MNDVCLSEKLRGLRVGATAPVGQKPHQGSNPETGGSYPCFGDFSPEIVLGLPEYKYEVASDRFVARYYDPTLRRFISADTIVPDPFNPQTLNRYSYCENNPLKYIDPSGHYHPDQLTEWGINKKDMWDYDRATGTSVMYDLLVAAEDGDKIRWEGPHASSDKAWTFGDIYPYDKRTSALKSLMSGNNFDYMEIHETAQGMQGTVELVDGKGNVKMQFEQEASWDVDWEGRSLTLIEDLANIYGKYEIMAAYNLFQVRSPDDFGQFLVDDALGALIGYSPFISQIAY